MSWGGPTGSTGPARRWTLPAYEQKGGPADGPEPDGSWKARDQAAPDRRRQRHPAGRRADPGQRPRVEHVAADARQDPSIKRPRGRPKHRPAKLHADKAYDHVFCRAGCLIRGVVPRIARRGIESAVRLGRFRWVVERSFAWLHNYRRLATRYERRADIHRAFLSLGAALICFNSVARLFC